MDFSYSNIFKLSFASERTVLSYHRSQEIKNFLGEVNQRLLLCGIACSIADDGIAVSSALSTVPDSTFGTNKENSLSCIFAICSLMTIISLHGV